MALVVHRPGRVPWRTGLVTICSVALALVAVLGLGLPAQAVPSPGDIENQIDTAWNQLEPVIEQYNKVHGQLQDTQNKVDELQKQIAPLQLQIDLERSRVGAVSADLYKIGPGSRALALLNAGSAATFADQMGTLDILAHDQHQQVAGVAALVDRYNAQKKPLDVLQGQLAAQDADLAAKKDTIQKQVDDLQKLRLAAYGPNGPALGALRLGPCPAVYYGDKGSQAAKKACSLIGKPYSFGAAGPTGYDCSGLTLVAWGSVGVTLGHYTGWQWTEGTPVTRAQLRPGDLVFYFNDLHHESIYVGGNFVVHAPHTGDEVRMAPLDEAGLPIAGFRRPG